MTDKQIGKYAKCYVKTSATITQQSSSVNAFEAMMAAPKACIQLPFVTVWNSKDRMYSGVLLFFQTAHWNGIAVKLIMDLLLGACLPWEMSLDGMHDTHFH